MNRNLNVVAIEDDIIWADKAANMAQLEQNLQLIPEDTDLVVLPEMFSTGFMTDKDAANKLAERNTESTIAELQRIAEQRRIAIAGSYLARTAGRLYNRAFFIEPSGDETYYDKHHLFRMGGERDIFSEGNAQAPTIRYRGWNIRLIVCYDLRFPVWCRNSEYNGYDLLIVAANWPKPRISAWHTLLAARAIENECYVCGVNRCGSDPSGIDYGDCSSQIIDYKGNIVAQRNTEKANSQIICKSLSYDKLKQFREKFPAWKDADTFSIVL